MIVLHRLLILCAAASGIGAVLGKFGVLGLRLVATPFSLATGHRYPPVLCHCANTGAVSGDDTGKEQERARACRRARTGGHVTSSVASGFLLLALRVPQAEEQWPVL